MRLARFAIPLLFVTLACEGPVGPMGPEGPPGEPGGALRYTASGIIDADGTVIHDLPAGVGAVDDLPVVTCYLSSDNTSWFTVMDGYTTSAPYCTVEVTGGVIAVQLSQAPPGWSYFIAVVI